MSEAIVNSTSSSGIRIWIYWLALNVVVGGYFGYALVAPASTIKRHWLPGETTHGHYQIELACNACHLPAENLADHWSGNVMQEACINCHGEQLELAKDTHPAKKFNDPTNAERLQNLDAQNCLACHREHVPELTGEMGVTVPNDYCWHCHQDVGESRPSHKDMAYDSCSNAGCHNYHDNRALYEKYLFDHYGEEDHLDVAQLPERTFAASWKKKHPDRKSLGRDQADAPEDYLKDAAVVRDWADTAHASAGVNCSDCHQPKIDGETQPWRDAVSLDACKQCHAGESESFLMGKHGMRLKLGLPAMTPAEARLPMHAGAGHESLDCNACHSGHRFDTVYAATDACLKCHADSHSESYADSPHAELWRNEIIGDGEARTGVSCATCHLPRLADGKEVWVNHDQNAGLRPNETMARDVCASCHGLEFSLSALSDPEQIKTCFSSDPDTRTESVEMAHAWFVKQQAKRNRKRESRTKK